MEEDSYLAEFSDDDVLSFSYNAQPVLYKVGKFRKAVREAFHEYQQISTALTEFLKFKGLHIDIGESSLHRNIDNHTRWFDDGVKCELLNIGAQGWQKGKIKVRVIVEFLPEDSAQSATPTSDKQQNSQPESPLLDDPQWIINNKRQEGRRNQ